MEPRRFVYVLRSDVDPNRHYVGLTSDVERRLHWHNTAPSGVTVHNRPWSLVVSLEFADAAIAARFERYLKTGSGRAFAARHFGDVPQQAIETERNRSEQRARNDDIAGSG